MNAWQQERKPRSHPKGTPAPPVQPALLPLAHNTVQRSLRAPHSLSPHETLQLQRTLGNHYVQKLVSSPSPPSTIQREPSLIPEGVGALNRPNWAQQHQRRYQELVGDLLPNPDPKQNPLLSFEEFQAFDKEYGQTIDRHGGATKYSEQFAPTQFQAVPKTEEGGFSFDSVKAMTHWDELLKRVKRIDTLNNGTFKGLMAYYITALSENNKKKAGFVLLKVIDYLDTISGFQVSRQDTKANQSKVNDPSDPNIRALQKETAKFSREHGQLWSKLNKYIAYETAKQEGGVSLERTLGAKLFDNLDFGTSGPVLGPQWTSLSAHFVRGLRGTIHAHAFRGAVTFSVFSSTEWPRIQLMLETGELKELVIHIYDFDVRHPSPEELGEDAPQDALPGEPVSENVVPTSSTSATTSDSLTSNSPTKDSQAKSFPPYTSVRKKYLTEIRDFQIVVTKQNYKNGVVKMLDQIEPENVHAFKTAQTLAHKSEEERNQKLKDERRQKKRGLNPTK